MRYSIKGLIQFFVLLAMLAGCAGQHSSAPVVDRYNPAEKPPAYYIVAPGDTLFSISWRYGFDLERLATANNIRKPYTIYPGEKILLQESSKALVSRQVPKTAAPSPSVSKPAPRPKSPPVRPPAVTPKLPASAALRDNGRWLWPSRGPLVRRFVATGQAHKGIDIKGKIGEPVRASRSGTVVYAGNGLVGYGNLLILKHADNYLSAYGHNRRLLKKEGDSVKAGEIIAELGDSGTDTAKLHFEVRKDGKPVDPLTVLPRQ
jgi:lipoprotein NlpD